MGLIEAMLLITWVFLLVWGVPIAIFAVLIWAAVRFAKRKLPNVQLGPLEGSDGA